MNSSEIRSALSRRFANVKFSRKINCWTMTNPNQSTILARRKVIVMKPDTAASEAADIVAFYAR